MPAGSPSFVLTVGDSGSGVTTADDIFNVLPTILIRSFEVVKLLVESTDLRL